LINFNYIILKKYTQNEARKKPISGGQSESTETSEKAEAIEEKNPPDTSKAANTHSQT